MQNEIAEYEITQDDLNSAARGLNMLAMSKDKLEQTILTYRAVDTFAAQVIARAAKQILDAKRQVGLV